MFSRFVRFYSVSDRETLDMPAMRFWLMNRNIDRIAGEESIRLLDIGIGAQSGDGYKTMTKMYREHMGNVVQYSGGPPIIFDPNDGIEEPDRGGLAALRMMQNQKIGDRI